MNEIKLGAIESRFADIIWSNEPLRPKELEALAEAELGWKRTTTLTILKRLCDRGIFQNKDGVVTSLVSKQLFQAKQSEAFVEDAFAGSLPSFVAAFVSQKKLSKDEISQLKKIIEESE